MDDERRLAEVARQQAEVIWVRRVYEASPALGRQHHHRVYPVERPSPAEEYPSITSRVVINRFDPATLEETCQLRLFRAIAPHYNAM